MISLQIFTIVEISSYNILIRINMVSTVAPVLGNVVDLFTHMSVTTCLKPGDTSSTCFTVKTTQTVTYINHGSTLFDVGRGDRFISIDNTFDICQTKDFKHTNLLR
jgi:hypothetical protein